jgi:superfamily II DNA or RNA helicase
MCFNFNITYIREHNSNIIDNVVKLGITTNIIKRNITYITGEYRCGKYIKVYRIYNDNLQYVDNLLKRELKKFHKQNTGGTEFYDKCIIDLIENIFNTFNIKYCLLTTDEINEINSISYIQIIKNKKFNKLIYKCINNWIENFIINFYKDDNKIINNNLYTNIQKLYINKFVGNWIRNIRGYINNYTPLQHQFEVLRKIIEYYNNNDIGKIIWCCGLGKTLLSLFIIELMRFKTILYGVSSTNLQIQMADEILKLYPNSSNDILFVGGNDYLDIKSTTDINIIEKFIRIRKSSVKPLFIIGTYHSCNILKGIKFDSKNGDECHHLVGNMNDDNKKQFLMFHEIESSKTLFMTATEKIIENTRNSITYSMDNSLQFGEIIDEKTPYWAIENGFITDYNVVLYENQNTEIDDIIKICNIIEYIDIFKSCYMVLKAFCEYNDLNCILLYVNSKQNADIAKKYIDILIDNNIFNINKDEIYNKSLHSDSKVNIKEEVNKAIGFKFSIISCVFMFGEGFNEPKLNGVCIADNMKSNIRITQYLLRPNRIDSDFPNKKAYYIISYNNDDLYNKNNTLYSILYQLKNIDCNIIDKNKIKFLNEHKRSENGKSNDEIIINNNIRNKEELDKIILYLSEFGCEIVNYMEEYNNIRDENNKLNIRNRKQYEESKYNREDYINNPEEHFKKKYVWTNWLDFFGCDISKYPPTINEWNELCKEKNISSLEEYNKSCELYEELPYYPEDLYIDFKNLSYELNLYNNQRR